MLEHIWLVGNMICVSIVGAEPAYAKDAVVGSTVDGDMENLGGDDKFGGGNIFGGGGAMLDLLAQMNHQFQKKKKTKSPSEKSSDTSEVSSCPCCWRNGKMEKDQ